VLEALRGAVQVVQDALTTIEDWRPGGERLGQYALDLVADAPVTRYLTAAGFGVLSEESGLHHPERDVVVVVDPVDGSTNASRRIPYYATSLCAVDADGALAATVVNLPTGETFEAVRGGGATRDGTPIHPSHTTTLPDALVAVNGLPGRHWGWAQFRSFGAAALDLCAVAEGMFDAFVNLWPLYAWDYLGGVLVCTEAGVAVEEADGHDLVQLDPDRRLLPMGGATQEMLEEMLRIHRGPTTHP